MSVIAKHNTPAIPKDLFFLDANGNMTRLAYADLKADLTELPDFPTAAGNYTLKITVSAEGAITKAWVPAV